MPSTSIESQAPTGAERLHQRAASFLDSSVAERIEALDEPRWINYSRADEVLLLLSDLLRKKHLTRMSNLLLVGDSNNGKTRLVQRFVELHGTPHVNENEDPVRPIIMAEAPPSGDEKELYVSILERFWTPYRATSPMSELRYQVIHLMRAHHVRMLIIDEVHNILSGTAAKQRQVMNCLKLMCNELHVPIVGVGTREAISVLHTEAQHASRFDTATLPLWELNAEFQRLLASFEKVLPLRKASRLHAPTMASKLHLICGGNLGDLHRLLVECAKDALRSGEEAITPEIVETKKWIRPTKGIRERLI